MAVASGSDHGREQQGLSLTEPCAESCDVAPRGPGLVGYPAPLRGYAGPNPADPPPRASVDDAGRLVIPAQATWGSVLEAVDEAAARAREREGLEPRACVHVLLPDACGLAAVGTFASRRGVTDPTGIEVEIAGRPTRTRVEAVGAAWVTEGGCDARVAWSEWGVSIALWREALASLGTTAEADEDAVHLRADPDLPAEAVLPLLAVAHAAGLPPVRLGRVSRDRKPFVDADDRALTWLSMHAAPSGAWDEALGEVTCQGRLLRGSTPPPEPETTANPGQTGLCLLAFLGGGYTNRGLHPYARCVSRGLKHLKDVQTPDGRYPAASGWSAAVSHGLGALAMNEAYGMTGSPIFKGSAQRALDALAATCDAAGDDPVATALVALCLGSAGIVNRDALEQGRPAPLALDADLVARVLREVRSWPLDGGDLRAACGLVARVALDPDHATDAELRAALTSQVEALVTQAGARDPLHTWLVALASRELGGPTRVRLRQAVSGGALGTRSRSDGHPCCHFGSVDPTAHMRLPGGRTTATALAALAGAAVWSHGRVFAVPDRR